MSIEVTNVTKIYGSQRALDEVTFSIAPGEIVGLLGPNGAGKSTLMKIITCFIPPTSGDVKVSGYDIFEGSIKVREKVGYLPEHNPLYLDMYVREYLEFIAGIYHMGKTKRTRVDEMISLTGLSRESKKLIGALSKGYRQRVGLAQALIHDPEVLILDEPTSGLDPNQILEIRNLIRNVGKESNKTVMLSTHIMQEVEAICDRAIIIHQGRIVADDATQKLTGMGKDRNLFRVEFNRSLPAKVLETIKGITGLKHQEGNSWTIETNIGRDIREELFRLAVDNDATILSLQKEELRMEDVFQMLTKS